MGKKSFKLGFTALFRSYVRRSQGGCLPMDPVFPTTVSVEAPPHSERPAAAARQGSLSPSPAVVRPISPMYDRSRPLSEILMETPTGFGDEDDEDEVDFPGFGGGRPLSSFKPPVTVPPPPPPKPSQVIHP